MKTKVRTSILAFLALTFISVSMVHVSAGSKPGENLSNKVVDSAKDDLKDVSTETKVDDMLKLVSEKRSKVTQLKSIEVKAKQQAEVKAKEKAEAEKKATAEKKAQEEAKAEEDKAKTAEEESKKQAVGGLNMSQTTGTIDIDAVAYYMSTITSGDKATWARIITKESTGSLTADNGTHYGLFQTSDYLVGSTLAQQCENAAKFFNSQGFYNAWLRWEG